MNKLFEDNAFNNISNKVRTHLINKKTRVRTPDGCICGSFELEVRENQMEENLKAED